MRLCAFAAAGCTALGADSLRALSVAHGESLAWIDMGSCTRLSNAANGATRTRGGIDVMAMKCGRALRNIDLSGCAALRAGSLASIGVACRDLVFMDVSFGICFIYILI